MTRLTPKGADTAPMTSRIAMVGRIAAGVAATAVLSASALAALAQNTSVMTPGGAVEVIPGFDATQQAAFEAEPATKTTQPLNLLLLGSDTREGQGSGFGSVEAISGARSDTAMLVHISADRSRATSVSFPRDLRVDIPACGTYPALNDNRFNVAFEVGGAACTTRVVEQLTGLRVDHVVVVDFRGFQAVVDALGGLDICLDEAVKDEDSKLDLPAGYQHVNGVQALALARVRKSLGDGSDTSRIGRQHAILKTAFEQVTATGLLADPVGTYQVLSSIGNSLAVSPSLASTAAQATLAAEMSRLSPSKVKFLTVPWLPAGDNETVVVDRDKAAALFDRLARDADEVATAPVVPGASGPTPTPSPGLDDTTSTTGTAMPGGEGEGPAPGAPSPTAAPTLDDSATAAPRARGVCGQDALF